MVSKIAWMVFPRLALQSRIQCGMNMQNWPGRNFYKSAYMNTVYYPGCRLGVGGSPSFWQFPWVFCW